MTWVARRGRRRRGRGTGASDRAREQIDPEGAAQAVVRIATERRDPDRVGAGLRGRPHQGLLATGDAVVPRRARTGRQRGSTRAEEVGIEVRAPFVREAAERAEVEAAVHGAVERDRGRDRGPQVGRAERELGRVRAVVPDRAGDPVVRRERCGAARAGRLRDGRVAVQQAGAPLVVLARCADVVRGALDVVHHLRGRPRRLLAHDQQGRAGDERRRHRRAAIRDVSVVVELKSAAVMFTPGAVMSGLIRAVGRRASAGERREVRAALRTRPVGGGADRDRIVGGAGRRDASPGRRRCCRPRRPRPCAGSEPRRRPRARSRPARRRERPNRGSSRSRPRSTGPRTTGCRGRRASRRRSRSRRAPSRPTGPALGATPLYEAALDPPVPSPTAIEATWVPCPLSSYAVTLWFGVSR